MKGSKEQDGIPVAVMTLEGIVVPRKWSSTGDIVALGLNTGDEREFSIESPGRATLDLVDHLRMRVRITGSVIGQRIVRISRWTTLDTSENPQKGARS
jgi:hypothetical protein